MVRRGMDRGLAVLLSLSRDCRTGRVRVITGLDHVQVAAPPGCEPEARGFYGALLGLTEVPKPASLAARGGVWFGVLHVGVAEDFTPARKAHPAFVVTDLDALAARLVEAGVEVRWDDEIPGVARFYAADPWGNRLEFLTLAG